VYRDLYWHDREFDTIEAIGQLARSAGLSIATLSVAWVLSHAAVTSAIVGASRSEQLLESMAGAETVLGEDLKAELDRITLSFLGGPAI
jgi:aryl-alcohol dehydrogenase-like predicted oxidoreductase